MLIHFVDWSLDVKETVPSYVV